MTLFHKFIDALVAIAAFILAYYVHLRFAPSGFQNLSRNEFLLLLPLVASASWLVFEWLSILSQNSRPVYGFKVASDDVKTAAGIVIFLILVAWCLDFSTFSRLFALLIFIFTFCLRIGVRFFQQKISGLSSGGTKSHVHNLLIVGSKNRATEVISLVKTKYTEEYNILGCLESDRAAIGKTVADDVKVIGVISDMEELLKFESVDEIIFAMPLKMIKNVNDYIMLAEDVGAVIRIIPDWQIYSTSYKPRIATLILDAFMGLPTLVLSNTVRSRFVLMLKETMDFLIALAAVLILSPLLIGIAVAIKIKSPGPILFAQERIGLRGRRFNMYKFRTMVPNAEILKANLMTENEADGPVFKMKDDPRIIGGLGHFLRRYSLDELPQFFNVLAGQMSVVGPRPPIKGEVLRYEVPELRRLSVKPGLTCIWQCMPGRNKVSFKTWVEKDLEYIDNWSLWLDLKILFKTALVVIRGQGL